MTMNVTMELQSFNKGYDTHDFNGSIYLVLLIIISFEDLNRSLLEMRLELTSPELELHLQL